MTNATLQTQREARGGAKRMCHQGKASSLDISIEGPPVWFPVSPSQSRSRTKPRCFGQWSLGTVCLVGRVYAEVDGYEQEVVAHWEASRLEAPSMSISLDSCVPVHFPTAIFQENVARFLSALRTLPYNHKYKSMRLLNPMPKAMKIASRCSTAMTKIRLGLLIAKLY